MLLAASFKSSPSFPTFSSRYLVGFHLQPILFYSPENVKSPVVPHRGSCFDDVVWFWIQLRKITDGTILLFGSAILLQVFLLLSKHSGCESFLTLPLFQLGQFYELSLFSLLFTLSLFFFLVHI